MVQTCEINGCKDQLSSDALAFEARKSLGVIDGHCVRIRTSVRHFSGLLVIEPGSKLTERIGFYMFDLKHVTAI